MTNDILQACAPHVKFEFRRLEYSLQLWKKSTEHDTSEEAQLIAEACLIHFRCALGFLYAPPLNRNGQEIRNRPTDITATLYLPAWNNTRPSWFAHANRKCNTLLVHLTTERLEPDRGWSLEWIDEVLTDWARFLEELPPERSEWFRC